MATGEMVDTEEIQFKIHSTHEIFNEATENPNGSLGLLTAASPLGLIFAGNPTVPEIKVLLIKQMITAEEKDEKVKVRTVPIQEKPLNIACSCDGALLAVNFISNGSGFLNIFSVRSFLTPQVQLMYNIRLSPEENVYAHQLLWCPVYPTHICVVLSNGGVCMYILQENGQFDLNTIDKSHQVKCGCWSPKGKQIVFGYPNGKLQQYKPNLTPVKALECPPNIHPGPFNVIAVHWLSTYQFAVIFLQEGADMFPSLYIMNAPKGATPSYVNFSDVCYSSNGSRKHDFLFTHVQKWNLLLVTSANGIDVGALKTVEAGDTPKWVNLSLIGEGRIEMPLVNNVDETFPIGFALDTSSTHSVTLPETGTLPVMPMVHLLSTHGHLISYDFINIANGAAGLCSPPPPIGALPPEFKALPSKEAPETQPRKEAPSDMSFNLNANIVTSTPAPQKEKPQALFEQSSNGNQVASNASTKNSFTVAAEPNAPLNFASISGGAKPTAFVAKPTPTSIVPPTSTSIFGGNNTPVKSSQPQSQVGALELLEAHTKQQLNTSSTNKNDVEVKQSLYSVTESYQAPVEVTLKPTQELHEQCGITESELDEIVNEIMLVTIQGFSEDLQGLNELVDRVFKEPVEPVTLKESYKRLYSLQQLMDQAKELEMQKDVQKLLQSLEESYEMMKECRYTLETFNNPNSPHLQTLPHKDKIAEKQLAKIVNSIVRNQSQMQYVQQRVDELWAQHQDTIRRQSKHEMHVPCLEGIYQRLTHLKQKVIRNRLAIAQVKQKLKQKGIRINGLSTQRGKGGAKAPVQSLESLTKSVENMTIVEKKPSSSAVKLCTEKNNYLIKLAKQYKFTPVRSPKRPVREDLRSEIILEYKKRLETQAKEKLSKEIKEETKPAIQEKITSSQVAKSESNTSLIVTNTTLPDVKQATSPIAANSPAPVNFTNQFAFGKKSFVNPNIPSATPFTPTAVPSSFSFTQTTNANAPFAFGQSKTHEAKPQQMPISFSAKVITKDAEKSKPASGFAQTSQKSNVPAFGSLADRFGVSNFGTSTSGSSLFGFGQVAKPVASTSSSVSSTASTTSSNTPVTTTTTTTASMPVKPSPVNIFSGSVPSTATAPAPVSSSASSGFGSIGYVVKASPTSSSSTSVSSDSTENLFNTLNICKPNVVNPDASKPANPFSGPPIKPVEKSVSETSNATSSPFSFSGGFAKSGGSEASTAFTSLSKPTAATIAAPSTTSGSFTFGSLSINTKPKSDTSVSTFSFGQSSAPAVATISTTTKPSTATVSITTASAIKTATVLTTAGPKTATIVTANAASKPSATSTGTAALTITTTATVTTTSSGPAASEVKPLFPTSMASFPASSTTPSSATISIFNKPSSNTTIAPLNAATATVAPNVNLFASTAVATATNTTTAPVTTIAAASSASVTTTTTSLFGSNIFGSTATNRPASNIFGSTVSSTAATAPAATNIFGNALASTASASTAPTPATNMFATAMSTASINVTPAKPGSIFSSPGQQAATGTNIFGTPTSPAAPPAGLFAAATGSAQNTAPSTPLFGAAASSPAGGIFGTNVSSPPAGNIFGGTSSNSNPPLFGQSSGGSIFGSSNAAPSNSVFGSAATPAAQNVFGSPSTTNQPMSASSIFGQPSVFAQNSPAPTSAGTGSIFGTQQTTGSIFGTNTSNNNSMFGSSAASGPTAFGSPAASSPSIFGGFSQPSSATSIFNTSGGGSGSFAQGGASVAQTGFGSPQQSAFAKPAFGAAPAFGSSTFGATPTFGGAATFGSPTFGSPKGFGTFGSSPIAPTAASPNTFGAQKNNLFETLGSSEQGLSFGNLAQTGANQQQQQQQQKPAFGGSKFMNYRA